MKFSVVLLSTLIVAVVSEKLAEKSDVAEGKIEKKNVKRGLYGLGYGSYGALGSYGTLGGYGLGSSIGSSYPSYGVGLYPASYPSYPASIHTTTVLKQPVVHPVPVPVHVPYPVEVARPYPIEVHRPYPVPVPVEKRIYAPIISQPVLPLYKPIVPIHSVPYVKPLAIPLLGKQIYSHDWRR